MSVLPRDIQSNEPLAKAIGTQSPLIVAAWIERIRVEIQAAQGQTDEYLIDHSPRLLKSLSDSFNEATNPHAIVEVIENAKAHALQRTRSAYTSSDLIAEYLILREVTLELVSRIHPLTPIEVLAITRIYEGALGSATGEFARARRSTSAESDVEQLVEYIAGRGAETKILPYKKGDSTKLASDVLKAERSLAAAREDLKVVSDAVLTLLMRVDLQHRYVFVNRAYEEWFGRPAATVLGHQVLEFVPPAMAQLVDEHLARAVDGEVVSFEHRLTSHDGQTKHFLLTFVPARDSSGSVIGTVVTLQDIEQQKRAELDAQERRNELVNVFSQAPYPIALMMGPEHVFTLANPPYVDYVGRNPIGRKVRSVFTEAEAGEFFKILDRVYQTGEAYHGRELPLRLSNKSGGTDELFVNVSYYPYRSHEGKVVGILAFIIDATQHVRAREALNATESRMRAIFAHASVGFAVSDVAGRFLEVNPRFCEITGYSADELKKLSILDILHPSDLQMDRAKLDELISQKIDSFVIEKRFIKKNGSIAWVRNSISRLPTASGEMHIIRVAEDVTAVREARAQLATTQGDLESERQKFRTLVADANTAMAVLVGPDLVYEIVNQSYANLFDNRELVGRPLLEALPELKGQKFPDLLKRAYQGEVYREVEAYAQLRRTNGGPLEGRYFDQSYTPIFDRENRPSGVFVQAIDVTERVQNAIALRDAKEQAELANAAKSSFLANMSHEIRTPLGAIMGFVSLIKDETITPQAMAEYVNVIDRNSVQLMRIIDDILDLSKVEAGMMLIEEIDFSLVELLSDFASLMGFRAREKGILFEMKARTELPDIVTSDPTRIRQILTNIVGNAIKFTDRGSVFLNVEYKDGELSFEVQDTGRGIANEQISKLFQPFSQGDASTTRKYGGTGLGLVLTRRLAEALGGKFELTESQQNVGSRFLATVKIKRPQASRFVRALGFESETIRNAGAQNLLSGLRILLVEDSPDNQALFSIYLNRAGAKIDIAADGAKGVDMALSERYDVILMDVQMPIMDGISAVKFLRSKGYDQPIIALTAHAMKEERQRCLDAGYTSFLSKPIQRSELINALLKFQN